MPDLSIRFLIRNKYNILNKTNQSENGDTRVLFQVMHKIKRKSSHYQPYNPRQQASPEPDSYGPAS